MQLHTTPVFTKTKKAFEDSNIRYILEIGGSRSSKTHSITQLLILYCLTNPNKLVSIVRKTLPALKATVMRDVLEVLNSLGLYNKNEHNKTENTYKFTNGSTLEFFSIDDEQKLRGRKRHVLWMNEANEITLDEFTQLKIRTTDKIIADFNPSDNEHWLYELCNEPDAQLIKSTYKDNPFLEDSLIKEIENLIKVDENYYKIYALGERPTPKQQVFTHFKTYTQLPENIDSYFYGVDWGFNHPTVLIKCYTSDNKYYIEEIFYKQYLTSSDIVREFNNYKIDKLANIYCDYARPEIIEDLKRNGFTAKNANKDVKLGIDYLKRCEIYININSKNILREINNYNWKVNKDGLILDEVEKLNDDAMDAIRYAIFSHHKKQFNIKAATIYRPGYNM